MPQVMDVADRILVLFHGRLIKQLITADTSVEEIIMWITGAGLARNQGAAS
jgi:ABC-type sugar transport system ATPase subunit